VAVSSLFPLSIVRNLSLEVNKGNESGELAYLLSRYEIIGQLCNRQGCSPYNGIGQGTSVRSGYTDYCGGKESGEGHLHISHKGGSKGLLRPEIKKFAYSIGGGERQ